MNLNGVSRQRIATIAPMWAKGPSLPIHSVPHTASITPITLIANTRFVNMLGYLTPLRTPMSSGIPEPDAPGATYIVKTADKLERIKE